MKYLLLIITLLSVFALSSCDWAFRAPFGEEFILPPVGEKGFVKLEEGQTTLSGTITLQDLSANNAIVTLNVNKPNCTPIHLNITLDRGRNEPIQGYDITYVKMGQKFGLFEIGSFRSPCDP
ncbi:MAG: hypothetical protein H6502_00695 [Candidatus Woesearchaeota archaeon]|nr:MAG: hypothetical protein H6502_00695 [Candidatus Woesearchaeota archaeon]